ncbi:hypothetical protein [Curtobacterium sp. VKM Ac-2884]|uniref:hypothetical protein n=1 Tax=Curtobacterium sp. VKM Ac-2884 TaxID=2783818 RepID=UPI00188BD11C|nr:hypothetical protein [Curtobacterium sp. VKM Ac-2884]MBF4603749.1 hypothetical protein [Curtobacterium sp. VKM Ac-2884]
MAEQTSTETKFTVARKGVAITALRPNLQNAQADLRAIEASMRSSYLEPDVEVSTVTVKTTISDPTPYVEPAVAVDEPVEEDGDKGDEEPSAEKAPAGTKKATH